MFLGKLPYNMLSPVCKGMCYLVCAIDRDLKIEGTHGISYVSHLQIRRDETSIIVSQHP